MPSLVLSGHQVRVQRHAARLVGRQAMVRGAESKSRSKARATRFSEIGTVYDFNETVQDMFITPLCQHHPSHTLASRAYGLQPHMRSSSATRPYIYTVCNFIYKVYFYIFYYRIQYEFKDGVYLPKRNSFYASTITLGCPRPSFENPFAGHAVSMLSMF